MRPKRGQAEVVGLLVIVILLLFVGVIFLRFYLAKPATSLESSRQSLEAGNVLNALMQVSINGQAFVEHADACYSSGGACRNLETELQAIFITILKPGQHYAFTLATDGQELLSVSSQPPCTIGIVSAYSFIERSIFYDATLRLC